MLKGMSERNKRFPAQSKEPDKYRSGAHTKHRLRVALLGVRRCRLLP